MKLRYVIAMITVLCTVAACKNEPIPKPKAEIRLEYPQGALATLETENFKFQYNELSKPEANKNKAYTLAYPEMNGAIFISYKKVENNIDKLIMDARRLSYEHAAKADNIVEQPYVNPEAGVYGALFEVQGNAASQSQFFVTDSVSHFLTGSVYFYTKPNYDSILPAAAYLQNDIRRIMETLRWKK